MIRIVRGYDGKLSLKTVSPDVSETVRKIINDVRLRGDEAVREYELKFDGAALGSLEVKMNADVSPEYTAMLERCAENIRAFHIRQLREGFMFTKDGIVLGQRVIPLEKVGLYVPGGTASYPSSVLMNAIPAVIAGCSEIVIATPPPVRPEIIMAAKIAGVHRIFAMGGAQAVAALAYGTETVPRVDKITGPGNVYVAEAKRQVFGQVSIDMVAGPSEILIIADRNNNPSHLAADML
ncbi:MAG: histidinol dehydrogenase, partial [Synergistaceae bacterium]|nr:histidinol dehydrogenase [Synergistaceae bacterium]